MNVFGRDAASPSSASVYIRQWEMFPKIILFDAYNLLSVMNFNKFVSFDIKFKRVTNTETGTRFSLDGSWGAMPDKNKDLSGKEGGAAGHGG